MVESAEKHDGDFAAVPPECPHSRGGDRCRYAEMKELRRSSIESPSEWA